MSDAPPPGRPPAVPLYRDLVRQLVATLGAGEWKPGEAIPAERRLAERYGVSIGTVRKAIDTLVDANVLLRQQGRGTFVATHTRDRMLFQFFHIVPERGPKAYPVVKLVAWSRGKADRKEAEALAVAPGDAVIRVRNLLELDGQPIIVDDIAIAAARFPGLTERQFRERPSTIYSLYEDAFGLSVVRARERLRAATADAEIAPLLAVPRGTPLLAIRRIAHTLAGDPIELRLSRVNTARHEYFADIDGGP